MKYTWDEGKNRLNRQKHGVDFADVPRMFDHPMVTFLDQKKEYREDRWVGIGWLSKDEDTDFSDVPPVDRSLFKKKVFAKAYAALT